MADYTYEEKETFDGKKVKVLGATYEEGKPVESVDWRAKLHSREEKAGYVTTAFRYWYSTEWFGSEKRKQDA